MRGPYRGDLTAPTTDVVGFWGSGCQDTLGVLGLIAFVALRDCCTGGSSPARRYPVAVRVEVPGRRCGHVRGRDRNAGRSTPGPTTRCGAWLSPRRNCTSVWCPWRAGGPRPCPPWPPARPEWHGTGPSRRRLSSGSGPSWPRPCPWRMRFVDPDQLAGGVVLPVRPLVLGTALDGATGPTNGRGPCSTPPGRRRRRRRADPPGRRWCEVGSGSGASTTAIYAAVFWFSTYPRTTSSGAPPTVETNHDGDHKTRERRRAGNSTRNTLDERPLNLWASPDNATVGGTSASRCTWSGITSTSITRPPASPTTRAMICSSRVSTRPVRSRPPAPGHGEHHLHRAEVSEAQRPRARRGRDRRRGAAGSGSGSGAGAGALFRPRLTTVGSEAALLFDRRAGLAAGAALSVGALAALLRGWAVFAVLVALADAAATLVDLAGARLVAARIGRGAGSGAASGSSVAAMPAGPGAANSAGAGAAGIGVAEARSSTSNASVWRCWSSSLRTAASSCALFRSSKPWRCRAARRASSIARRHASRASRVISEAVSPTVFRGEGPPPDLADCLAAAASVNRWRASPDARRWTMSPDVTRCTTPADWIRRTTSSRSICASPHLSGVLGARFSPQV